MFIIIICIIFAQRVNIECLPVGPAAVAIAFAASSITYICLYRATLFMRTAYRTVQNQKQPTEKALF